MVQLRVKKIAESQGLNAHSLSQRSQVAYSSIHPIWNGKATHTSLRTLEKVALALGVNISELFDSSPSQARV